MEIKNLSVNMMVRDEYPTVFFALLSVLPHVERAVVVDTGSKDGTWELLQKIKEAYPEKVELHQRDLPDSSGWSFFQHCPPNKELGKMRQFLAEQTKTDFIWLVDGDEVYRDASIPYIERAIRDWPKGINGCFVPLLWFGPDIEHIAITGPPTYGITCRLFRREGFSCEGAFPGEMAAYNGKILGEDSPDAIILGDVPPMHHYEMVTKPWRRKLVDSVPYSGPQPEVFARYGRRAVKKQKEAEQVCLQL